MSLNIKDADGVGIHLGSVLRNLKDGNVGVVTHIYRQGDFVSTPACVGDIQIVLSRGCYRVTNIYHEWKHVPKDEQTFAQRFLSWFSMPGSEDYASETIPKETQLAITGILSLMPEDVIDNRFGNWPTTTEEALELLADYLDDKFKRTKS